MNQFFIFIFCLSCSLVFSQEEKKANAYIDINYFKGNIALHDNGILHLINGHPEGVILAWNKKTYGFKDWEQRYNYPDYGVSFTYQNLKNAVLGDNYGLYVHYNLYFLKRNLMLRIGHGLAYNTNPFDKAKNPKNIAFGSKILSSTYLMLNYKKERIIDQFGLQAGLALIHYSNANVSAPNTSVNTITLNVGLTYSLISDEEPSYQNTLIKERFRQPIKYNFVFRSGLNESDVIGSGQFPFYIFSAYADKRLSHKSAIQFGTEVFFSKFLKELIAFNAIAFPERDGEAGDDYKRVGVFVGHELFINKMSIVSQLGYYIYYPYDFEGRVYLRAGLKRYFGNKWFAAATLKAHGAKAEAVEFGIGIRL